MNNQNGAHVNELEFFSERIALFEQLPITLRLEAEEAELQEEEYRKMCTDLKAIERKPVEQNDIIRKRNHRIRQDLLDIVHLMEEHDENPKDPFISDDTITRMEAQFNETNNGTTESLDDESTPEESLEERLNSIESRQVFNLYKDLRPRPSKDLEATFIDQQYIGKACADIAHVYEKGANLARTKTKARIRTAKKEEKYVADLRDEYDQKFSLMMNSNMLFRGNIHF